MDVASMSNEELRDQLVAHGIMPGPVVATTRKVYEAKLRKVIGGGGGSPKSSPTKRTYTPMATAPVRTPAVEPNLDQIRRSRRREVQVAPRETYEDPMDDDYDDENYEGEESSRLIGPDEDFDYSSSALKYSGAYGLNDSPNKSYTSDLYSSSSYDSGSKYGSTTGARGYKKAAVYEDASDGSESGFTVPTWLKMALLVALTVFIFFVVQRAIENSPTAIENTPPTVIEHEHEEI